MRFLPTYIRPIFYPFIHTISCLFVILSTNSHFFWYWTHFAVSFIHHGVILSWIVFYFLHFHFLTKREGFMLDHWYCLNRKGLLCSNCIIQKCLTRDSLQWFCFVFIVLIVFVCGQRIVELNHLPKWHHTCEWMTRMDNVIVILLNETKTNITRVGIEKKWWSKCVFEEFLKCFNRHKWW